MPIAEIHVGIGVDVDAAAAIDAARLDQHVLGLAAIGAAIHAQRAADRARNAAQEGQPGDAGLLCRAGDFHVRHRSAGANVHALDRDLGKAAAKPDHHARHPAVADDKIGAKADHGDGDIGRQFAEQVGRDRPRPPA